jgi:acetolactate synthase I/II/III large subunit
VFTLNGASLEDRVSRYQTAKPTIGADRIVTTLQGIGVKRLFGMPGGGSNADLIEAAMRIGLPFSLAHTETASAFMATAQAEITGQPGACLATLGPGAASLMNGVANAYLDRVPLMVLTDCHAGSAGVMQHQTLSHGQMFSPVVKWSVRLRADEIDRQLQQAVETVSSVPYGPVHLDISSEVTSVAMEASLDHAPVFPESAAEPQRSLPQKVQQILRAAKRPVFLLGLGARSAAISREVREMCERFNIPALVTYKAKGVVPDTHPWFAGVLTNGALEREVLEGADAFLAIGLDPVELLPKPWTPKQPIISITPWPLIQEHIPFDYELVGPVVALLQAVAEVLSREDGWSPTELLSLVRRQRNSMRPHGHPGELLPHRVVEIVADRYPGARITVDAGAFMLPVMALWPTDEPVGALISNGLSTMGFALPAAIGATLLEPSKPVIAFTGDGGLLMCLGDLRTASRESLPVRVIVFDDGDLSLIKIKQIQRGYQPIGVSLGEIEWQSLGAGLGVLAVVANSEEALNACLVETVKHPGPVLIAARISSDGYQATIRAMRG